MALEGWTLSIDWNGPSFISKNATILMYASDIRDKRVLGRFIRNGRRGGYRKVPERYRRIVYGW